MKPKPISAGTRVRVTFEAPLAEDYDPDHIGIYYWSGVGKRYLFLGVPSTVKAVRRRGRQRRPDQSPT